MSQASVLIVTNFVFVEGLKVFQIYPFVRRYLVAPFAISQKRKNQVCSNFQPNNNTHSHTKPM